MRPDRRKITLIACAAALLIPAVRGVLLPFLLALFLAGCMQRPIAALERRRVPRWLTAVGLLLLCLAPLLLLLCYWAYALVGAAQSCLRLLLPLFNGENGLEDWLYRWLTAMPPALREACSAALTELSARSDELLTGALSRLGEFSSGWLAALPGRLADAGLFLLFFLFCAIGYPELRSLLRAVLPAEWQVWVARIRREAVCRLGQWCGAELRLVGLICAELAIGLALLRVEGWPLLALTIALVDLIPLVGSGLLLLPWAAVQLLTGHTAQAAGLALLWACVWLTRTLLEPKMVGRQLQLPTAVSFLAAILGARLWGLKGLILFPVLAAVAVGLLGRERTPSVKERGHTPLS